MGVNFSAARRAWLPIVVFVALALLFPHPATAQNDTAQNDTAQNEDEQPDSLAVELDVEVGVGGLYRPGKALPVRVTVTGNRLIDGTLRITTRDRSATVEIPVEVAGGSVKTFATSLPTRPFDETSPRVELVVDDEVIESSSERLRFDGETELVGVMATLASIRELPETSALAVGDLGQARLAPIAPELLQVGAPALEAFDQIAVTGSDLAGLDEVARASLFSWIADGGQLLVDEVGGPVPALPDRWQPLDSDYRVANGGMVVLTGGLLADGKWDEVLKPTGISSNREDEFGIAGGQINFPNRGVFSSLTADAGFELPDLPWLLVLLGAYALVVGPLAYLLFSRLGRPGLLWVFVPLAALGFTGLVYVFGSDLRDSTRLSHATIIELHDGGAQATTHMLVTSRDGSDAGLALPAGWSMTNTDRQGFENGTTRPVTATVNGTSTRAEIPLDPGGIGVVTAAGPISGFDAALTVEAASDTDGEITGSVTNNLDVLLDDVAVFSGGVAENVGEIAPGETVTFDLARIDRQNANFEGVEWRVWPDAVNDGEFFEEDFGGPFGGGATRTTDGEPPVVNIALWADFLSREGIGLRPVGQVVVAAWSNELDGVIDSIDGNGASVGRSVVVARTPIDARGPDLTNVVAQRTTSRSGQGVRFTVEHLDGSSETFGGGFEDNLVLAYRFRLPDAVANRTVDLDRLVLSMPTRLLALQVWDYDEQAWLTAGRDSVGDGLASLPPSAVSGGTILVRMAASFDTVFGGGFRNDTSVLVRERRADEDPADLTAGLPPSDTSEDDRPADEPGDVTTTTGPPEPPDDDPPGDVTTTTGPPEPPDDDPADEPTEPGPDISLPIPPDGIPPEPSSTTLVAEAS